MVAAGALALGWLHAGGPDFPAFEAVRDAWRPSAAYLLDRHGEPIHVRRIDHRVQRRPWVPLDQVSPPLVRAEGAVVIEVLPVALELLPIDVAGMDLAQHDGPIGGCHLAGAPLDPGCLAGQQPGAGPRATRPPGTGTTS